MHSGFGMPNRFVCGGPLEPRRFFTLARRIRRCLSHDAGICH